MESKGANSADTVIRTFAPNRLAETIIGAIADAKGVKATELDTRLYDIIDPDALERLFQNKSNGTQRHGGRVSFTMADCEVVVESSNEVTVTAQQRMDDKSPRAVSRD